MLKRTLRTSPSETTYVFPSSRCSPLRRRFRVRPGRTRSSHRITSARMKPRAMSVWIDSAASSAVCPRRSVQARASVSPAVKNVIRSSDGGEPADDVRQRRRPPSRNCAASSGGRSASSTSSCGRALRAVHDREQRLRRQRLELGRKLAGRRAARAPASTCASSSSRSSASARLAGSPDFASFGRARAGARRGRGRRPAARAPASGGLP